MRDLSEVLASLQAFRSKFEVLAAARKKAAPARGAPDRRPTRLRELTGFGANPVNLRMFAYAPEDLLPKRSIRGIRFRPCYLRPEGKVGHDAFAVVREAIREMDKVAIGRVVLTNREHIIAAKRDGPNASISRLTAVTLSPGRESGVRAARVEGCFRAGELNRASTAARVPSARLGRLDLQVCICQSKDIRIRCIV